MFTLTNGRAILDFYGGLPWPIGEVPLPVVHYGSIVVWNTKTVDCSRGVFPEVVFLILVIIKENTKNVSIQTISAWNSCHLRTVPTNKEVFLRDL